MEKKEVIKRQKLDIEERKWWVLKKEKIIGEMSGLIEGGTLELKETFLGEGSFFFQKPLLREKKLTIKFKEEEITQYMLDITGAGRKGEYGEWIMDDDKELRRIIRVGLEMVPPRGAIRKDYLLFRAMWISEDEEAWRIQKRKWAKALDLTWDWTPIPYAIEKEEDLTMGWIGKYKKGEGINYDRIGGLLTGKIVEISFDAVQRNIKVKGEQEILVAEVGIGLGGKKTKEGEYLINDKKKLRDIIRILEDRLKGDVRRRFIEWKRKEIEKIIEEEHAGVIRK